MKVHKVLLFPLQSGQHWSLLVLVVEGLLLFAVDSGKGKIFGHSDMQYGSFIGVLEQVLKLDPRSITYHPLPHPSALHHSTEWLRLRLPRRHQRVLDLRAHRRERRRRHRLDEMGLANIDTD